MKRWAILLKLILTAGLLVTIIDNFRVEIVTVQNRLYMVYIKDIILTFA